MENGDFQRKSTFFRGCSGEEPDPFGLFFSDMYVLPRMNPPPTSQNPPEQPRPIVSLIDETKKQAGALCQPV